MERKRQRAGRPKAAADVRVVVAFKNAPVGPPSVVVLHPDADAELAALRQRDQDEWKAVAGVVEKLKAVGPRLGYPHSSAVQGAVAKSASLRELRPRRGSSPTRPLYFRIGGIFVILAIAPEAQADRRGFDAGVASAAARAAEITVS